MNKIIKLLTLISFSLIITLSSCSSPKDTTSYRGVAKTKNGRFVKYKNRNPTKKFLAFKSKKKLIKTNSRRSFDQPSEKLASIDLNNDLIADNSESNYQIYLKKDNVNKVARYTKPVVEDELLFEKAKTKKYIEKNSKNKSRDNSSVEASEIDDAKFDADRFKVDNANVTGKQDAYIKLNVLDTLSGFIQTDVDLKLEGQPKVSLIEQPEQ